MNADTSKGRLISNKVLGNELHEAAKNSYDSRFKSTVEPLLRFTSNPESAQNYVRHSEYYTSLKNSNYQTNFDRRVSVQGNSGQSETGQVAVRTDNYMDLSKELDERIAKIREKYYAIKFPVFDKSQQQVSQKRGQENI